MNKSKLLKLTTLLVLVFPMTISCGGGDDKTTIEPQNNYVEDEREAGINKLCQMFGINKNILKIKGKKSLYLCYQNIDIFRSIKIEVLMPNVWCPLVGEQIPYLAQIHVTYF